MLAIVSQWDNKSVICWNAEQIVGETVQVVETFSVLVLIELYRSVRRLGRPHRM